MDALVSDGIRQYGRLDTRPRLVNPLDEYAGRTRRLWSLRLKEWIGFTLIHPELYSSLIIQDAHYLASSEIYAYDTHSGLLHQHSASALRAGRLLGPELFGSICEFGEPGSGYHVRYEFDAEHGTHRVSFEIAARRGRSAALTDELTLHGELASPPLSVSSHLPGTRPLGGLGSGSGPALYTHKRLYPASGQVRVADREIVFDAERDLAIIDEHKSLLPYRTRWLWGTFARIGLDGPIGANFVSRPELEGEPEESCIWTASTAEPLTGVHFAPESADPLSAWRICSDDGRLEVRFEPDGRKDVRRQLVLAAIDYFQLFGRYSGTLRGAERDYSFKDVHGVCESMQARL